MEREQREQHQQQQQAEVNLVPVRRGGFSSSCDIVFVLNSGTPIAKITLSFFFGG